MTADVFVRRHDEAIEREAYSEAVGWSRLAWLAEPGNPRWRGQVGMNLVQAALVHREAGDWHSATRAARQARAALAPFSHPSGNETLDNVIEAAEAIYAEGSAHLARSTPAGFRAGADTDLLETWITSLDAQGTRALDWVRIAGSLS